MKLRCVLLGGLRALLLGLLFCSLPAAAGPKEGQPAPRLIATSMDGRSFDTEALQGKVVVIGFWATWCSYCRQELADLDRFNRKHGGDGLVVISINVDDEKKLEEVRQLSAGFSFPVVAQKAAAFKDYGRIWRLPLTFVIDRQGILRRNGWESEPSVSYQLLEEMLAPLLKEAG